MMKEKVEAVLVQIRPALEADGGSVELVDLNEAEGIVTLLMVGSCSGCPSSLATLKLGIERMIKETVPEVKQVIAT